jgi:hypothetical protein
VGVRKAYDGVGYALLGQRVVALYGQRLVPFIGHTRDRDLGVLLGAPARGRGAEAASAADDYRRSVGKNS